MRHSFMLLLVTLGLALSSLQSLQAAAPFRMNCYYENKGEKLALALTYLAKQPEGGLTYVICAKDQENPKAAPLQIFAGKFPGKGRLRLQTNTDKLPEHSKLLLVAELKTSAGKVLQKTECELKTPANPAHWRNFKEGIPDGTVPQPWTPVQLEGRRVKVWGREFQFDQDSPLPSQILSQGKELLTEPAQLLLTPAVQSWKLVRAEQPDDTTARMLWQGVLPDGKTVTAKTEIYFDGILRLDLELPQGAHIEKYAQKYSIPSSIARTLHRGPWAFGGVKTTYPVKPGKDCHPIRPQLFLFNDFVGFGWFDGMQFNWPLAQPGSALIVDSGNPQSVVLQVNYIDAPTELNAPRTYTTGLQPLPVRPLPPTEKGLRMCYSITYGDLNFPAWLGTVDYLAENNFRQEEGTAEMHVKLDFDPASHQQEELFFETSHGLYLRCKFGWMPQGGIFAQIYEDCVTKVMLQSKVHPARGEWHHFAVSWGKEIAIYMDGEKLCSAPYNGSARAMPAMLHAGGKHIFLDGLKISSKAREDFRIDEPPVEDDDTLLLDNFDDQGYCNGRQATLPEKISEAAEAGYPTPDAVIGEGRWGNGIAPMTRPVRNMLEGYRHYGIDVFCFHASQYTDEAMAGMYIHQPENMRRTVDAIHNLGARAILYINNSLSNWDRSWQAHEADWLIEPRGAPFIQAWLPQEKSYQACPRCEYIDYFFWRLAKNLDDFQLDGAFLDGRMYTTCHNRKHGCDVVDFNGQHVAKRDVWDGRMKAWRLYNIVKKRGGYCEQHKSSIWDAPTCFFWDAVWEGEQFMLQEWKPSKGKRTGILPVDFMRSQINGLVYGLPSRFTAYYKQPFNAPDCCTYAFVHGTTWTMTYRIHEAAFTAPYWKALDDFGATYQNFRPYWGEIPPASAVPTPLLKVSAYAKPGEALLILANFNEDQPRVSGKVRFNGKALGVPGPWTARDAFSGEEIPVTPEGDFEVDIKSFRQMWIRIESANR